MTEQKKKIVCIDDEQSVIDLVQFILKRGSYEVTEATSGQAGLEAIRRVKPDVVLLDLMMPGMDGWAVYQQMKSDPDLQNIPVIVLTAKAAEVDRIYGRYIAGVDEYITKPFHPYELLRTLDKVLGQPTD